MREIIYAMQFRGQAAPSADNPNLMNASTTASSCSLRTVVDTEGLNSSLEQISGGTASFVSEVTLTGGTGFQESGTITFGDDRHRLHFSTVGEGYLSASPDEGVSHGAVIWKIDRGEGQFEGAAGLITSNFTVSETGAVTDNQFGVIFLK